ncbi:MAG: lytic transglycosylase domain-containing protein [Oligoflexia bacterium]|nr:lytic transglycosylase domain-containing protein [Oligoflexia bacterium]
MHFKAFALFMILFGVATQAAVDKTANFQTKLKSPTKFDITFAKNLSDHYKNLRSGKVSLKRIGALKRDVHKTISFKSYSQYLNIYNKNYTKNPTNCLKFKSPKSTDSIMRSVYQRAFRLCFNKSLNKRSISSISLTQHKDLSERLVQQKEKRLLLTYIYLQREDNQKLEFIVNSILKHGFIPNSKMLQYLPISTKLTQFLQVNKAFDYGNRYFNRELKVLMANFKNAYFSGDEEQAQEILNEALDFYKNNRDFISKNKAWTLFLTSGKKFLRNKSHEVALDFFKFSESVGDDEDRLESLFQAVFTFIQKQDYAGALRFIEKKSLIENYSTLSSKLRFWIAYTHDKAKEWTTAKHLYQKVISLNPLSFYSILSLKNLSEIAPEINIDMLFKETNVINTASFFSKSEKEYIQFLSWIAIKDSNFTEMSLTNIETKLFKENKDIEFRHNAIKYLLSHLSDKKMHLSIFKFTYKHLISKNLLFDKQVVQLLFPFEYFGKVSYFNKNIDPIVPLSLIRQESAFNTYARSHAGARGLMQLLPTTARSMKRKLKSHYLYKPSLNIKLGSQYLTNLIKRNEGNLIYALASYNAGEGNVRRWRNSFLNKMDPLYTIESIPFKETRNYVKLIYRNMFFYQLLKNNREFFKKPLNESLVLAQFKR